MQYLNIPLLKSSAKDLLFKCVLLYMGYDDYISADAYYVKFLDEDPTFVDSREARFLKEGIQALKDGDLEKYKAAVSKYKEYNDVDKIKTTIFYKIFEKIGSPNEYEEDGWN